MRSEPLPIAPPPPEDVFDPGVRVLPADDAWPMRFAREAARLRALLGPTAVRIEHVGSTAVPGLAARPIVDVQVAVAELEPAGGYRAALERLRYALAQPRAGDERRFVKPADGPRAFLLHVCAACCERERRRLAVRDYLRAHADDAAAYAALKRALVAHRPCDLRAYLEGKAEFMAWLEQRAAAWAACEV